MYSKAHFRKIDWHFLQSDRCLHLKLHLTASLWLNTTINFEAGKFNHLHPKLFRWGLCDFSGFRSILMCVSECECIWVCECVWVYVLVCEFVWVCVTLCECAWVYVSVWECVLVCEWVYVSVRECMLVCVSVCECVGVYVLVCEIVCLFLCVNALSVGCTRIEASLQFWCSQLT
jgi:hypothetical protein